MPGEGIQTLAEFNREDPTQTGAATVVNEKLIITGLETTPLPVIVSGRLKMQLDDAGNPVTEKLLVATNFVVPATCAMEKLGTRTLPTVTPPHVNVEPAPVLAIKVAAVGFARFNGVNSTDKAVVTAVLTFVVPLMLGKTAGDAMIDRTATGGVMTPPPPLPPSPPPPPPPLPLPPQAASVRTIARVTNTGVNRFTVFGVYLL